MPNAAKKYFSALLLMLCVFRLWGQRKELGRVDSLLALLPKVAAKDDTNKIHVLTFLAFNYFTVDPDKGIQYGEQALALSQKLHWKQGLSRSFTAIGANYWAKNDLVKALDNYLKGLRIDEETGDSMSMARNLNNIAGVYQGEYNFPKAIECYERAIIINNKTGNSEREQGCYQNIAQVNEAQRNYTAALENYTKALNVKEAVPNKRNRASVIGRMGLAYAMSGNYAKALELEDKALKTFEVLYEQDDIVLTIGNIGYVHLLAGNYLLSLEHYQKAKRMTEGINGKFAKEFIGKYSGYIGKNYLMMATDKTFTPPAGNKFYQDKKALLQKAVENLQISRNTAEAISDWNTLKEFLSALSQAQMLQGNYKEALAAYKEFDVYKDSLYNTEKEKEITKHEMEYEYGRQQDSLRYVNNLQQSKLNALSKEKELSSLRLKQQLLYLIVGLVAVCLIGLFFAFRSRIRHLQLRNELAKEKAEKELKEAEYKNRMNDITYAALRSQMNPHFIFNCLNSIKLYAEQNNTQAASEYLTKFSKLIRMILDHSRSSSIVLSSEIELLHLYLEMEAMRFKSKLQYKIEIDDDVEADFIEIPPMLIQPYVENAIWHGLMHKEAGGTIKIKIAQSDNNANLVISVADTGIGRIKAAELRLNSSIKHTSHGTQVTAERIALLNERYQAHAEVNITDLEDADNQPLGTLVIIKLPIK